MPTTPKFPTSITVNGIVAEIVTERYRFGESLTQGPWREIVYQVDGADAANFIDSLMGLVRPKGTYGGGAKYTKPHQFPKNEVLYCVEAHAEPVGVCKPGLYLHDSDFCHVTARYEVPRLDFNGFDTQHTPDGQSAIPWTTWAITGKTRIVQVPRDAIQVAGGEPPLKDQPRRVHVEEMRLTYHYVPYMPLGIVRPLAKRVNQSQFLDWPEGQVLFDEYRMERNQASDGTTVQTIELVFLAQDHDWNEVPQDEDMGYTVAKGASNDEYMYPYDDLSPLLNLTGFFA